MSPAVQQQQYRRQPQQKQQQQRHLLAAHSRKVDNQGGETLGTQVQGRTIATRRPRVCCSFQRWQRWRKLTHNFKAAVGQE